MCAMCGLGGEFRLDGAPADVAAVERMSAAPAAPGARTATGAWQRGPVALVHRRLTIIDLSDAGAQPMVDAELGPGDRSSTAASTTTGELRDELTAAGYPSAPPPTPR